MNFVPGSALIRNLESPGYLVNGSFGLWQRGNGPFTADTAYSADRWQIGLGAGSTISVTLDTANNYNPNNAGAQDNQQGSLRSLKAVYTHAAETMVKQKFQDWQQLRGRPMTLRCWVKTTTANAVRLGLNDGVSAVSYSAFHSGSGAWELLSVVGFVAAGTGSTFESWLVLDASCTAYFDSADLITVYADNTPYWEADPTIEKYRCARYYQLLQWSGRGKAVAGGDLWSVPLTFLHEVHATPTVTVTIAGTPTNLTGNVVTYQNASKYSVEALFTPAAAGAFSLVNETIALESNP